MIMHAIISNRKSKKLPSLIRKKVKPPAADAEL